MKDMKENTTQEKVSSQAQDIMIKVKSKAWMWTINENLSNLLNP